MEPQDIRIMLVEDNPEDVAFTKRVLRYNKLDKDLVIAVDGKEAMNALELLAKVGNLPNIILLDINLPDISGIELLTKIKKDMRFNHIPIIMLTGSNIDDDIQRSYDLGASTYLVKPISKDALMLVVQKLFNP
ncbi:MAG: response regulator [Methanotrichaceae archaeon]